MNNAPHGFNASVSIIEFDDKPNPITAMLMPQARLHLAHTDINSFTIVDPKTNALRTRITIRQIPTRRFRLLSLRHPDRLSFINGTFFGRRDMGLFHYSGDFLNTKMGAVRPAQPEPVSIFGIRPRSAEQSH